MECRPQWNDGLLPVGLAHRPAPLNLVNIGPLSGTSATVNLPTNGATVNVRLWTVINGTTFVYNDYTYTAAAGAAAAAIVSPTPGSTLTAASTTFTWNAGPSGTTGYYLWVGTSPAPLNLVNIGPLPGTSATVNLPTNGSTISVRLWTVINGCTYFYNDYTYTAAASAVCSCHRQSSAGQHVDLGLDHLHLDCGPQRNDRLLPVGWHITRCLSIWSTSVPCPAPAPP